jgi:hypothetical protein
MVTDIDGVVEISESLIPLNIDSYLVFTKDLQHLLKDTLGRFWIF